MPAPRKPKGKKNASLPPSALESEKRILQERQRQLDEKIEALNRTIMQASAPGHRLNSTLAQTSTGAANRGASAATGPRRVPKKVVLRAERQEGRLQTLALLVVVIALLAWMVYRYL